MPMTSSRTRPWMMLGLLLALPGCEGLVLEGTDEASIQEAVVGGNYAPEPEWNAVVMLSFEDDEGFINMCSGVLVNPTHVLTAFHCVASYNSDDSITLFKDFKVYTGPDRRDIITKLVNGESVKSAVPVVKATYADGFSNLAALELARPLADVTPIPVDTTPLKVGQPTFVLGYGHSTVSDDGLKDVGRRRAAIMRVAAVSGYDTRPLFESFNDYMAYLKGIFGRNLTAAEKKDAKFQWNERLLTGAEFLAKTVTGVSCFGDSGGPLLTWDGGWKVRGVTEASSPYTSSEEGDERFCRLGTIADKVSNAAGRAFLHSLR